MNAFERAAKLTDEQLAAKGIIRISPWEQMVVNSIAQFGLSPEGSLRIDTGDGFSKRMELPESERVLTLLMLAKGIGE